MNSGTLQMLMQDDRNIKVLNTKIELRKVSSGFPSNVVQAEAPKKHSESVHSSPFHKSASDEGTLYRNAECLRIWCGWALVLDYNYLPLPMTMHQVWYRVRSFFSMRMSRQSLYNCLWLGLKYLKYQMQNFDLKVNIHKHTYIYLYVYTQVHRYMHIYMQRDIQKT